MADWFAQNAPQGDNWFSKNAPASMPDPGVPNPLHANPDKYTPEGLQLAPWGVPSSGPHKSFADTFGHDTTVGKAADTLATISDFLPSNEAMIGASAPATATGVAGAPGFLRRAASVGGGIGTEWAVEKGLRAVGVPPGIARAVASAAGIGVGSKFGHGPAVERPVLTTDLGTTAPTARGPIAPSAPLKVSPYSATGGTIEVPPPPTAAPAVPETPSLDALTAGQTGGRYKKFSNAPADVQGNIIKLHNRFNGQQPTPKPVPTTAAPPVVAPPPVPEAPPAPSISQPLGKVAPQDRETNLVNMLRANTTRKNLEIGQYFAGKNLTPEAVATMPEETFNAHVRNVKNASGNPYEPSTGRNYHRTFEQARAEVVKAMQEMMNGPVPPPPPPQ